jgi:hypothetical protein
MLQFSLQMAGYKVMVCESIKKISSSTTLAKKEASNSNMRYG